MTCISMASETDIKNLEKKIIDCENQLNGMKKNIQEIQENIAKTETTVLSVKKELKVLELKFSSKIKPGRKKIKNIKKEIVQENDILHKNITKKNPIEWGRRIQPIKIVEEKVNAEIVDADYSLDDAEYAPAPQ